MIRRLIMLALAVPFALGAQNLPAPAAGARPLDEVVRAQLARVLKNQVGLSDAQLQRVQELNTRLDAQRRQMNQEEGRLRQALRDEVTLGDSTRNPAVGDMLDRLMKIERQRAELFEQEHKELGQFMTPMQHAKYLGVQEAVRRRVQQLLAGQPGDSGATRRGMPRKRPE
ncbi:MAG: hypothetical protein HYR75_09635 [Gemmatimonadetes bacterium]|nr:hypothetical protein [Gemmatimonadota bacterium]MBI3569025.1 hypothetical protein [Gemmatimonadota bacterium]